VSGEGCRPWGALGPAWGQARPFFSGVRRRPTVRAPPPRPVSTAPQRHVQIPPDFVVKSQAIDVAEVILALIRQLNLVSTLWRNRQSRRKRLSISEAHRSTTKADGMCSRESWGVCGRG